MKSFNALGFVLTLGAFMLACDPISGQLQVSQSFNVKTTAGDPRMGGSCPPDLYPCDFQEEVIALQPGSYRMNISQFGGDTIRIGLKTGRKDVNVDLALPRGQDIPSTGHISLRSQQTGQPFDLEADTKTTVTETAPQRDVERCEIEWEETVCDRPHDRRERECHRERFSRPGSRDVEYFHRTTYQEMQSQISVRGSQVASFNGSRSSTNKIYTYEGQCIEDRGGGWFGR